MTIQPWAKCLSWDIGPDIGSLTLRAVPGLPVIWALGTVDGWTPQDPVFDLRLRDGSVRTFPLAESGGAWSASLTASDTEVLHHARHARLRDGERVIAAGPFAAHSGWAASSRPAPQPQPPGMHMDLGPDISSITLRVIPGMPVTWVFEPIDGYTPVAPVLQFRLPSGPVTHPIVDGALTLDAGQTADIAAASAVRLADSGQVIAAGHLRALSGWDADCTGGSVPVRIVAGAPGRGIVSISAPDEVGVATVTYTDGTVEQLAFPSASGGVSMAQVAAAIAEALGGLSSGGAVHLGEGPPPDLIVGAVVGDVYIDTETGTIYALQTGA